MPNLSTKKIYSIGVMALVLGLLFDYLFFNKQVGISFFVYVTLLLAGLFVLFSISKVSYNKNALWYLLPIGFFSVMIGIRDSVFLLFWNLVLVVGLLLVMAHHLTGKSLKDYVFVDFFRTAIVLPLKMLGKSFNGLGRMLTVGKGAKDQKSSQILKGIAITLPLVIFFVVLLSSADLVFNRLVVNLFSFNINPATVAQVWWALFFTFIWLGAYLYILEHAEPVANERVPRTPITYKFGSIEAGILFGTLNVVFLVFVIIQIRYLFAGQGAVTNFGFTYAEYAHKGFGELVAVALLTFGLIFGTEKYIEKKNGSHAGAFKVLSGISILLVLVIMASAFLRLSIYEQAYSFTLLRVLVQGFILWLVAVFLWLGYKIFFQVQEHIFTFGVFATIIVFFFILNLVNPDALIARKNIDQFALAGKLDSSYLYELSADAAPQIARLLTMNGVTDKFGRDLPTMAATILLEKKPSYQIYGWQSYNYSRSHAMGLVNEKWSTILNLSEQ